jgi:hypothetical protein
MPTLALELETVLHGQLAGHEAGDALILTAIDDGGQQDRLARRATHVAQAAAAIGLPVAALLSASYHRALSPELTPAGRLVLGLPDTTLLDRGLAGLLAGAGALQALTLALAHARRHQPRPHPPRGGPLPPGRHGRRRSARLVSASSAGRESCVGPRRSRGAQRAARAAGRHGRSWNGGYSSVTSMKA